MTSAWDGRDRFMDALRVGGVLVVIAGHWLVLIPYARAGVVGGQILYEVRPEFWPLTWAFNVLPLFFFVGGFANHTSYAARRGPGQHRRFRSHRLRRLLAPTAAFLGVWLGLEVVLQVLQIGAPGLLRGMRLGQITPFESLWFLAVYIAVVLLSPAMLRLHRQFSWAVPLGLLAATGLTDLLAYRTGVRSLLLLNLVFVWLLPHQLGFFYAEGRLQLSTITAAGLLGGALALTWVLTGLSFYSRNLLDGTYSYLGIAAPTLPFALLGLSMVSAALLVRRGLVRLLETPRAWRAVARLNSVVMTLFLWHMTAYFAVVLLLAGAGFPLPDRPDSIWWLERPLLLLLPIIALVPLAWVFARFERPARPADLPVADPRHPPRYAAGGRAAARRAAR